LPLLIARPLGASDGTIEPEMRGLYILLMFHQNTDFKNFLMTLPYDLHKTAEVKLAIEAVISLRHRDYAKFFKMLRSRCGYIYSCVLFKHVNTMRKTALQIMSKIYGRVPNEYPLERLTRLLCFNDYNETISQLKHYSIPYNENTRKVEFEHSTFSVPDKKIVTRKMAVIELKVTRPRLYICRGGCETVMGMKRKLTQIPSSISNATTFQASVRPSAPTTFESFGKITKQAPAHSLAPTGLSSFGDTNSLSPVPAVFAPTNFSGNSNSIRQAPVPSLASTSQQAMAGLPKKSETEERRLKMLEDEMVRKQQAFMREQLEKEAKAEAEREAKMVAERKKEEARRLAKEAEAERQREIRIAEEKRKEKEEEENRIKIKQEKERQRRIELAKIEARKAAEAAEAARRAKLKAEAELKARLEAEERKRQAELKAEAERKARMEAERKERERLAELERQRLEILAAEKRRQQIEIDRATKAFYIKKWYNHPKLVKLRRKEKTRLSLEKLSSIGTGLYDISDFEATFAGLTATAPSLDTTTFISNFFSHAANTPNLMNIVNLLSDKIASSSIILMKIAIVLPRYHPLNSSIQLWLESRLNLGDVSSIATARFCAVFAVDIDDLAGCDAILFIRPPASLGDSSFDVEIMEYSNNMVNCTIEMHASAEQLKTAQEDSNIVVDVRCPTEKMMDKALLRGIYRLISETKHRALEKVNLASSIRLILQQYMRDHVISISQIDQLFQTLVEELHGPLSKVPDRFADYPAIEFAIDDFVEGYYLYDTNEADLPLNWRIELARSQTKLREALTKSVGLGCILKQNRASISVQQQVMFYLSRNENNLATIATIQYLENNDDFVIGLPVGFMNEVIRMVGEKVRHIFVESADLRKKKRDMIPSKERITQSADRPRLHDTKPAMKPRTLSFGNNEAANTKRPLDLISANATKDSCDQIKPDDVLLGFIDIGKKNQRPQSPKRLRAETSPSKSVIRRSKSNSRNKFLQLSESKEYTKRLEAMLSGKSSIDYTVAFLP